MTLDLTHWLMLSALLFSIGLFGVMARRNALSNILCIELMANAVNLNLVAFGQHRGDETGQVMMFFGIGLALAEVLVGLAIVRVLHREHKTLDMDDVSECSG